MNRKQFMEQLERLLSDISEAERQEALEYYEGYFDDAGPENEGEVIRELGNPGKVAAIIKAAVANARAARAASTGKQEKFIALDVGPCGKLLRPYGDLDFEEAVKLFSRVISLGAAEGVDLVMIETMNDSYETKAALLAAKENSTLPIMASMSFEANGRTFTRVQQLDRKQRQMELARLTGGSHVTETMLQGAEELLTQAEKFRAEISE